MRNYTVEYVTRLEEKLKIAEEALEFYAKIKHIKKYIPEHLRYAMMPENSSRYKEEIIDRGEVAREALSRITESHNDKLLKSLKQAENGELVEVNIEDL